MTNKKILFYLALPITVIVFILFTKWWIADIVDASDGIMYGFPLIYKAPAFHTSMAQQYFIMELLIDFLIYFTLISLLLFSINQFIVEIKFKKKLLISLYIIAVLLLSTEILIATVYETNFLIKRDFDIEVKQTGFKFNFSNQERIEFDKFHQ